MNAPVTTLTEWVPMPGMDELTKVELRVAVLTARGCTNKEIATELYVSVNTVKTHIHRILQRNGAKTRAGLVGQLMMDDRFRDLVGSATCGLDLGE